MPKYSLDLSGRVFGRLAVVFRTEERKCGSIVWECRCECGKVVHAKSTNLHLGLTRSCGCYQKDMQRKAVTRHGRARTPEYRAWADLKVRCTCQTNSRWDGYGGRGISVCERWLESFEAFFEDMGERPSSKHSIDRIDNNGNYEPSNCRWATWEEQYKSRSCNVFIEYKGETDTISGWSRRLGIHRNTLDKRIKNGIPIEEAFNRPVRRR